MKRPLINKNFSSLVACILKLTFLLLIYRLQHLKWLLTSNKVVFFMLCMVQKKRLRRRSLRHSITKLRLQFHSAMYLFFQWSFLCHCKVLWMLRKPFQSTLKTTVSCTLPKISTVLSIDCYCIPFYMLIYREVCPCQYGYFRGAPTLASYRLLRKRQVVSSNALAYNEFMEWVLTLPPRTYIPWHLEQSLTNSLFLF